MPARLTSAHLASAQFTSAYLTSAHFASADLTPAHLTSADILRLQIFHLQILHLQILQLHMLHLQILQLHILRLQILYTSSDLAFSFLSPSVSHSLALSLSLFSLLSSANFYFLWRRRGGHERWTCDSYEQNEVRSSKTAAALRFWAAPQRVPQHNMTFW